MKLAVNYSDILLNLFEKNPDLPVDYIKVPTIPFPGCREQFVRGARLRRLLPHPAQPGVLSLGEPDLTKRYDLNLLRQICHETSPPYLSTHLEVKVDFFPCHASKHHENDPELCEDIVEHFGKAVRQLREWLGVPIVLENFPYYSWWIHYRAGSEPSVIDAICARGDCGFLLDISHARCSAWTLGMDAIEYVRKLPLERLKEIHLSGARLRPEGLCDSHTAPQEEDYRILEYLLGQSAPEIVTIEYGGMPDRILNIRQEFEPISRNDPGVLTEIIGRTRSLILQAEPD